MSQHQRLNPDDLLKKIHKDDQMKRSGQLRIFLGMSAGVGKTYAMLKAAHQKQNEGFKVLVGVVETHGRQETAALLNGLEILPKKKEIYRNTPLEEFDIDEVLRIRPDLVIIDELAHNNTPGSRHPKRYQDVIEILDAGIDVYTAINVQHLESRKENVEQISGIIIRETVPDSILERAQMVELIDIAPSELLKRLKDGKIYIGEKAEAAAHNFFKEDKLTALREIALRMTAERVDQDLQRFTITKNETPWQTNERLLVAVSHSPSSESIIRATRRLAYNLEAPWIALHVDTGITLSEADQIQLQKNLNLARELKAEVLNTTDTDVATAIQRISRQKNVTQVVVGRPTRRWFSDFLEGGSLLQRLVKENQEFDVHVIRQNIHKKIKNSLKEELIQYRTQSGWTKYYYIACFFIGVTLLGAAIEPWIGYRAVGFLFLLAVVLTSLWGSIGAILFSATLSALIWNIGFIPPKFTFVVSSADDFILLLANFVVALTTGILTNRTRIRENLIRNREEKTNLMNRILEGISQCKKIEDYANTINPQISQFFGGNCSIILKDKSDQLNFNANPTLNLIDEKEQAVVLWSFQNQKNAGWSTETLNQSRSLYIPLRGSSQIVGVFVFKPQRKIKKLNVDQKELLISISHQLAHAIERHILNQKLHEAERLKDSELLHQTLLNSISHEMRTPLTTIIGVASALQENKKLGSEVHSLTQSLSSASDRLNRVIENLLDMSRINSGSFGLKLEWHDLSDLLGVVLKKLERNLIGHKVELNLAENIDLIQIDFRLFEHALSNLILNATQYAGDHCQITIQATKNQTHTLISVSDNGIGIPSQYQTELFQKFYRVPGSPMGGTGLGLSIVQGIIELHKGSIEYQNNFPQGSTFLIQLPYLVPPAINPELIDE